MTKMKLYVDTHDCQNGTFPAGLSAEQFRDFYQEFLRACDAQGVVHMRAHIGLEDGRAYCFCLAPSIEAVQRAHQAVHLPYDAITQVDVVTPGDMFLTRTPST
ncbi:MAG TPA: nickel-binding protein [Polyangiaceae bacterium]|nr:nickel-binding protein [Polyangiaceae bacterium]